MALSAELISQFAKITNDKKPAPTETTVYGTVVDNNGTMCVQLDGAPDNQYTPVTTLANVKAGERVTVLLKDHTATITGSITAPSASVNDVTDAVDQISEFEVVIADRITTESARIDTLVTETSTIKQKLTTAEADIHTLKADEATIKERLTANEASIESLETDKLEASVAVATYATIESLNATNTTVHNLNATYGEFVVTTTDRFTAVEADISELQTDKLSVEDANITFANIDFSNIGNAAMEYLYSKSGLIESVTVADGTITGVLAGVTIRGDMVEAGTLVADKLVIQGEDGLYYKLNTDGATIAAEQTEYNSLNGQVILAKSITATQISVDDLVAFDATIGGFSITDDAIFSNVKDSEDNTTRGTHLGADGQVNFGDADKFLKYYQDEDGVWRLVISADTILYDLDGTPHSIADLGVIGEYVQIGTYEGEPCIELGETDSDFKLRITNTRMLFMEGTNVVAYISNQSLHIKKAVIEEELQQGEFVWKARSNGNLGLIWKGVTS